MAKCPRCGGVLGMAQTMSWRGCEIGCLEPGCNWYKEEQRGVKSVFETAWWKESIRKWDEAHDALRLSVAAALSDYPEEEL